MRRLLVGLALTLIIAAPAHAQKKAKPAPLTIFVFTATDPSGFVDQEQKARLNTVRFTKRLLAVKSERKRFRLVESRAQAQLVLEIIDVRSVLESDSPALLAETLNPKGRSGSALETHNSYRYATLTVGTYTTELRADVGSYRTGLVGPLKNWLKLNADKFAEP